MPIPDDENLGGVLEKRLKAALDEVVAPSPMLSSARYRAGASRRLSRAWRFAPALVAVGAAGVALTAAAATGSPNPAVWKDRAGTVIQNVSHFPISSPKAVQSPKPQPRASSPGQGTGGSHPTSSGGHELEPKPPSEPTEKQKPSQSPDSSSGNYAAPTPSQDQPGGAQPVPSPTPSDNPSD